MADKTRAWAQGLEGAAIFPFTTSACTDDRRPAAFNFIAEDVPHALEADRLSGASASFAAASPGNTSEGVRYMCKNATATAAALMSAIEPTLVNLLTQLGILNTPDGQAAKAAFDKALQAVENWQSGTPSQTVIEAIDAFTVVFNALPIPAQDKVLANVIVAGITAVIGVLNANAPAPAHALAEGLAPDDAQAHHQVDVVTDTSDKVKALVPGFKRSIFTPPAQQYKNAWNHTVKSGNLPAELQVD